MSLKNVDSENLLQRWNVIIGQYLDNLSTLKENLIKINKLRNELLLIREELVSRNIEIDDRLEEND